MRASSLAWLCAAVITVATGTPADGAALRLQHPAPAATSPDTAPLGARTREPRTAPRGADARLRHVVLRLQRLAATTQLLADIGADLVATPRPGLAVSPAVQTTGRGRRAGRGCRPGQRLAASPALIAAALADLNMFWCQQFALLGSPYRPVASIHPYHGQDAPSSACGVFDRTRNARYCPADRSISYDVDWFTQGVSPVDPGNLDEAVVVLAHEFGHHVQHLLGTAGALSSQAELEADCYAGVYLHAVERGVRPVHLERTAFVSVLTMVMLADASSHFNTAGWRDPGAHGDALTRRHAWALGFTNGDVPGCAAFARFTFRPPLDVGDHRLVLPPGTIFAHDPRGAGIAFAIDRTDVMVGTVAPTQGDIARPLTSGEDLVTKRWAGWQIRWGDPARRYARGATSLAMRGYVATATDGTGRPLIRHGVLLVGVGRDGAAFLVDGSRPGPPSDASLDDIGAALIETANGSSALLGW